MAPVALRRSVQSTICVASRSSRSPLLQVSLLRCPSLRVCSASSDPPFYCLCGFPGVCSTLSRLIIAQHTSAGPCWSSTHVSLDQDRGRSRLPCRASLLSTFDHVASMQAFRIDNPSPLHSTNTIHTKPHTAEASPPHRHHNTSPRAPILRPLPLDFLLIFLFLLCFIVHQCPSLGLLAAGYGGPRGRNGDRGWHYAPDKIGLVND